MPKVVIGENVAGITMGEAKEYFNRIVNEFDKLGYETVGKVLNAADYGTPQGRQRCFFVAIRNDIMEEAGLNFMTLENEIYPQPYEKRIIIKRINWRYREYRRRRKRVIRLCTRGLSKEMGRDITVNPKNISSQVRMRYVLFQKTNGKNIRTWGLKRRMRNLLYQIQILQ